MADASKFSFAKLSNNNWQIWKFRMEMLLTREELWHVVSEPRVNPVTDAWLKDDRKARATIGLCIEDNQLAIVKDASSAKDFWDSLRLYHEKTTMTSRVSLLKRLCSLNLEESHLMVLDDLFERLTAAGQTLEDSLRIAMILRSLPDSYGGLVTALESRPDADLTMQLVKTKLLDEYERKKERSGDSGSAVKAMKSMKDGAPAMAADRVCFYCKKPGHLRRNCHLWQQKKRNGEKSDKKKSDEKSNAKQVTEERCGSVCFMVGNNEKSSWIIDSGASCHMTNEKRYFTKFCEKNGPNVILADGKSAKTVGRGEAVIMGEDGDGQPIEVKLEDVLFVPSLTSGLISVDRLAAKGFTAVFDAGGCKIIDAIGKAVVVGDRSGCLYKLKLAEVTNKAQDTSTDRITISRDARFLELNDGSSEEKASSADPAEVEWFTESEEGVASKEGVGPDVPEDGSSVASECEEFFDLDDVPNAVDPLNVKQEENECSGREDRARKSSRRTRGVLPERLSDFVVGKVTEDASEPTNYKEAVNSVNSGFWKEAMDSEMQSHFDNGTWQLVPLPAGKRVIGSRWVYKVKRNES